MSFASVDGQLKVLTRGVERVDTLDELPLIDASERRSIS